MLLFQDSHRTVSESFWGLKIVNIFDAKLSCYKKWEIFQLLQSFFRKPCPHFASVFNLPARRSFFYTAAGGLLSAVAPSNYINTKSASSLPLHVMMFCFVFFCFFLSRVHNRTLAAALWTSSLYRGHIGVQTPFIAHVPWQNLIDVAELDRNVTKRERSQQKLAGRDGT